MFTRSVRRNDARIRAKAAGRKLRDLWQPQVGARYEPYQPKPSKYMPHQGERECARRLG